MDENNAQEITQSTETKTTSKSIQISTSLISVVMGIAGLLLYVILQIILHFGQGSFALLGVFSIFTYGLPLAGLTLAYFKDKKFNLEFWFNAVVFCLVALTM